MYKKYLMTAALAFMVAAVSPALVYAGESEPIDQEAIEEIEQEEKIPVTGDIEEEEKEDDEGGEQPGGQEEEPEDDEKDKDDKEDDEEGEKAVISSFSISPKSDQIAFGAEQAFTLNVEAEGGTGHKLTLHVPDGMEVVKAAPSTSEGTFVFRAGEEETEGTSYEGPFSGGDMAIEKEDGSPVPSFIVTVRATGRGSAVLEADYEAGEEKKSAQATLEITPDAEVPEVAVEDKERDKKTVTISGISIKGLEDGAAGRLTISIPDGITVSGLSVPEMDNKVSYRQDTKEIVVDMEAEDGSFDMGEEKITMDLTYDSEDSASLVMNVTVSSVKDGEEEAVESTSAALNFEAVQKEPEVEPVDPDPQPEDPQPQPQPQPQPDDTGDGGESGRIDDSGTGSGAGSSEETSPIDDLTPSNDKVPVSPVNPYVPKEDTKKSSSPQVVDYTNSNKVARADASDIVSSGANRASTSSGSAMTDRLRNAMANAAARQSDGEASTVEQGTDVATGDGSILPGGEAAGGPAGSPALTGDGQTPPEEAVQGRDPEAESVNATGTRGSRSYSESFRTKEKEEEDVAPIPVTESSRTFAYVVGLSAAAIGIIVALAYFFIFRKDKNEDKADKAGENQEEKVD